MQLWGGFWFMGHNAAMGRLVGYGTQCSYEEACGLWEWVVVAKRCPVILGYKWITSLKSLAI
jgi:hypothetical protein